MWCPCLCVHMLCVHAYVYICVVSMLVCTYVWHPCLYNDKGYLGGYTNLVKRRQKMQRVVVLQLNELQ